MQTIIIIFLGIIFTTFELVADGAFYCTTESFYDYQIMNDIVDTLPTHPLNIEYLNLVQVDMGNELTPTETQHQPQSICYPADRNSLYTLMMLDPDYSPLRLSGNVTSGNSSTSISIRGNSFLHWLVINIPGNDIESGETMVDYIHPAPKFATGYHRYVFLVYRQQTRMYLNATWLIDDNTVSGRTQFNIRKFLFDQRLNFPLAGNFFNAQFDPLVSILQHQLAKFGAYI